MKQAFPSLKSKKDEQAPQHVQRLAKYMLWLTIVGGLAGVCAMASSPWWMDATYLLAQVVSKSQIEPQFVPAAGDLSSWARGLTRMAILLPGIAGLGVLFTLYRLMTHYASGDIFGRHSARLLRNLGTWSLSMGLLQVISASLSVTALTMGNPPGRRLISISFSFENYTVLILSGLILVVGWVMVEAARLAQENQEFV